MKQIGIAKIDWWLLTPVVILLIISLTTLLSLNKDFFFNQLFTLGLGLAGFFVFSQIPYETLKRYSVPIYVISLLLLIIVLVLGFEAKGATRWISLFGISLQPSEVLKPFLAVSFSTFLVRRENTSFYSYLFSLLFLLPVFILVAIQPDLGNALIYAGVIGIILLVYGFPFKWFVLSALPFVIASPFLWQILHDYQRQRLLTFINPTSDPLGSSYNVIQAMIAVGSGMFMGKGLSQGTQSGLFFLPERHTDFIFATISEGMGFVGSFLVILCLFFLCFRIYAIYVGAQSSSQRLFAAFAFAFLLVHFFVNIGMNIGLLPIVGVTLPFVSFGGSSLLSNFILLGILSSIRSTQKARTGLEIR